MKRIIKLILTAVSLTIAVASARAQPANCAWIVNSLGETLTRVDLSSGNVQTNAVTVGSAPNDIIVSGSLAYVVNSLSNNVQLVDLEAQQTVDVIEIYLGINPYFIALEGDTRAFVTNFLTGNVSVLDLEEGTESEVIQVGGALEGVCVGEDRLFITDVNYGAGSFGPGHLYAFSLETLELDAELTVGINPQVVKWGPDGMLHVVCTGDFDEIPGEVYIIDPATMSLREVISIGGSPGSLAFNSQGIAYLGAAGWSGSGAVYSYDGFTYEILRGEDNPIVVPSAAMGLAVTPDDDVLVCCFNTDELVELDADGNSVRTFIVGDGPVAVAVQNPPGAVEPENRGEISLLRSYNFPQPFNSRTTLVYSLLRPSLVELLVFNSAGELVQSCSLGNQKAGLNRTVVTLSTESGSGCYYYKINAGSQTLIGKLLYLK